MREMSTKVYHVETLELTDVDIQGAHTPEPEHCATVSSVSACGVLLEYVGSSK